MSPKKSQKRLFPKAKIRIVAQIPYELAKETGIPIHIAAMLHNQYCEVFKNLMWRGNRVRIKGFGTFWRRYDKIYNSLHPKFRKEIQNAIVKKVIVKSSDHLVKYRFKKA